MDDQSLVISDIKVKCKKRIAKLKEQIKEKNKLYKDVRALDPAILSPEERDERLTIIEAEIKELENELNDEEVNNYNLNATQRQETAEGIAKAMELVESEVIAKDPSVAYINDLKRFIRVTDYSSKTYTQNVVMRIVDGECFVADVAAMTKVDLGYLPVQKVRNLFSKHNRVFESKRFSLTAHIWEDTRIYLPLKHLEKYFINNHTPVDPHPDWQQWFECLMYSLSGGKQENQEAIEKWIVHKIINYRKVTNTPELVVVGHVGGNGKGILEKILTMMLPAQLTGKANTKTLNNGFNAALIDKLIVIFDDQDNSNISLDKIKELSGASDMVYERKGEDQYVGEKTFSGIWFSNSLPFQLTPQGKEGGVDRRFSITATNITLFESIQKLYKDKYNTTIDMGEVKTITDKIVTDVLYNRNNIAMWFEHLQQKYPEIDEHYTLLPLHGEDYNYFLNNQIKAIEILWEKKIKDQLRNGGVFPVFVVNEMLKNLGEEYSSKKLDEVVRTLGAMDKVQVAVDRKRIAIVSKGQEITKTAKVYYVSKKKGNVKCKFDWSLVSRKDYNPNAINILPDDCMILDDVEDNHDPVGNDNQTRLLDLIQRNDM